MRFWTTMPKEVYEDTILKNGVYICDPSKCNMLLDETRGTINLSGPTPGWKRIWQKKLGLHPPESSIQYGHGTLLNLIDTQKPCIMQGFLSKLYKIY